MTEFTDVWDLVRSDQLEELERRLAAKPQLAQTRDEQGLSLILKALYERHRAAALLLASAHGALDEFEAAAVGDCQRLAQLLQEDPRRANSINVDGFSALQLAAYFMSNAAVELLLAQGADVSAVSENGMALQALHAAASSGDTVSMRLLIAHGADINSEQHGGFRALHAAAANGNAEQVELLLAAGAEPYAATAQGQKAADLAAARGHGSIALRLHSAPPRED